MIQVDSWHRMRAYGVGILLATVVDATNGAAQTTTPTDHSLLFHLATAPWSPPYDGPLGYPKGAQRAPVSVDFVRGGETYYAHFPLALASICIGIRTARLRSSSAAR